MAAAKHGSAESGCIFLRGLNWSHWCCGAGAWELKKRGTPHEKDSIDLAPDR